MITIQPEIEILSTESYEDMLRRIEKIGRVCYKSEERIGEGTAEKFIAGIIKRGHESVIEHGSITVKVTCDRGVTHEIVRHRIASYSQESTRYCNYSKDKFGNQITCIDLATGFSYDLDDENDRKKYEVWQKAMEAAEQYYFQMLELGAKPEEARSILPKALQRQENLPESLQRIPKARSILGKCRTRCSVLRMIRKTIKDFITMWKAKRSVMTKYIIFLATI